MDGDFRSDAMIVRVQEKPFDAGAELEAFRRADNRGATVMFIGTVREMSGDAAISAMTLEHYPGMTERALEKIAGQAMERWPLTDVLVIHRHGRLEPGEDIVLVITASSHRAAAFDACQFLMDWLKTKAPFWKLEETPQGSRWVEAKDSDDAAAARWED